MRKNLSLCVLLALGLIGTSLIGPASAEGPTFSFPVEPDHLLLAYSIRTPAKPAEPLVSIFGDGRVRLQRGAEQGQEFVLTAQELDEFLATLSSKGLMDLNSGRVKQLQLEAQEEYFARTGRYKGSSETAVIAIEIHLEGYRPASDAPSRRINKTILIPKPDLYSQFFPDTKELQSLFSAVEDFNLLLVRRGSAK